MNPNFQHVNCKVHVQVTARHTAQWRKDSLTTEGSDLEEEERKISVGKLAERWASTEFVRIRMGLSRAGAELKALARLPALHKPWKPSI